MLRAYVGTLAVGRKEKNQMSGGKKKQKNNQGLEPPKILGKYDSTDENMVKHKI